MRSGVPQLKAREWPHLPLGGWKPLELKHTIGLETYVLLPACHYLFGFCFEGALDSDLGHLLAATGALPHRSRRTLIEIFIQPKTSDMSQHLLKLLCLFTQKTMSQQSLRIVTTV